MANIKSAKKRAELAKVRTLKNAAAKSSLRTTIRRFDESLSTDLDNATLAYRKAARALDKAASKGLIHSNTAARKNPDFPSNYPNNSLKGKPFAERIKGDNT